MKTMQETNDGFVIAEKDLELRGTGEFLEPNNMDYQTSKIANLFCGYAMLKNLFKV